jgi:glycosyltransferase involved in cell wall biosynthesis
MRVLHVITGLAAGGAEQELRDLLRHTRHEAEVVTLSNPGVIADEIRADGVPVTDMAMRGNTDLRVLPRLTRFIRQGGFDVAHVHLYRACLYGRLAARLARVRTVLATEHSLCDDMIEGRPVGRFGIRELYLAAERLGQVTVAVSPTVLDLLTEWGVPRRRITMIPNGIDASAFRFDPAARQRVRAGLGLAQDARVVGSIGRLAPAKHVERLIEAVAGLPAVTLVLVGDGDSRIDLEQQVRRLGMLDRVVFTGESRDVPAMYSAIDVYATASPHETFGLALLEALASGLPSTYVTCPAIDETTLDSLPTLHRVESDPEQLRDAITTCLAQVDASDRIDISPASLAYDISGVVRRIDDLYDELHDTGRPRVSGRVPVWPVPSRRP